MEANKILNPALERLPVFPLSSFEFRVSTVASIVKFSGIKAPLFHKLVSGSKRYTNSEAAFSESFELSQPKPISRNQTQQMPERTWWILPLRGIF